MTKTLFISYSHNDEEHKNYVVSHLSVAEKQGILETWDDRRIEGGGDWRKEIEIALAEAKVAILLVSRHSLSSDFILNEEVSRMLHRRDQEGLSIFPIIVHACDWEAVDWLKAMNVRPRDGKPLSLFSPARRDLVMAEICKEIRGLLDTSVETTSPNVEFLPSPIDEEIERLQKMKEELRNEFGISSIALSRILENINQENVPANQMEGELRKRLMYLPQEKKDSIAKELINQISKINEIILSFSNTDDEIILQLDNFRNQIMERNYEEGEKILRDSIKKNQIRIKEDEHLLRSRRYISATLYAILAEIQQIQLNYLESADSFGEASEILPNEEERKKILYLEGRASSLYQQGDQLGDNLALNDCIEIYERILREHAIEGFEKDYARIESKLGNALRRLGGREVGTGKLEEAVRAFHRALEVRTKASDPKAWAETQNDLGRTYRALSLRERSPTKLTLAIDCYNDALSVWSKSENPNEWASGKNNLGYAYWKLGEREEGTDSLEEAIAAFQAALEVRTKDNSLEKWAETQRNLGIALTVLGQKQGTAGTTRVREAIEIFELTFNECNLKHRPLLRASIKNHLGIAQRILGDQENSLETLERAVKTLERALRERKRSHVPIQWAHTKESLGLTYCAIAKRTKVASVLTKGISFIKAALEIYQKGEVAYDIQTAKEALEEALCLHSELEGGRS